MGRPVQSTRISSGGIDALVSEPYKLRNVGSASFRQSHSASDLVIMKQSKEKETFKLGKKPGELNEGGFIEIVDSFLARKVMYLANATIKHDWVRHYFSVMFPSYQILGDLYIEDVINTPPSL